jgi:hypothetical protein
MTYARHLRNGTGIAANKEEAMKYEAMATE